MRMQTLSRGKVVQYLSILTLAVTVLTAVPLFLAYLNGNEGLQFITDIHVWIGVIWVILAASNFLVFKRPLFQFRRYLPD
ncbi:hypothetical protein [Halodesulfurarchaeum sp.]